MKQIDLICALLTVCAVATDDRIEKLGNPVWAVRERATQSLVADGPSARMATRAAMSHGDPEVRHRARLVWERIRPPVRAVWVTGWLDSDNFCWWNEWMLKDQYPDVEHVIVEPVRGASSPGEVSVFIDGKVTFTGCVWHEYVDGGPFHPVIRNALRPD